MKHYKEFRSNIASLIVHAYETNDSNFKYGISFLDFFEKVNKKFPDHAVTDENYRTVHIPEIDEYLFINLSYTIPFEYFKDIFTLDWLIKANKDYELKDKISTKLIETGQFDKLSQMVDLVNEKIKEEKKYNQWDFDKFLAVEKQFIAPILSYVDNMDFFRTWDFKREDVIEYDNVFEKALNIYVREKAEFENSILKNSSMSKRVEEGKWFANYKSFFSGFKVNMKKEEFTEYLIKVSLCSNMLEKLIKKDDFDLSFLSEDNVNKIVFDLIKAKKFKKLDYLLEKNVFSDKDLKSAINDKSFGLMTNELLKSLKNFFTNQSNFEAQSVESIALDFKEKMDYLNSKNINLLSKDFSEFVNVLIAKDKDDINLNNLSDEKCCIYQLSGTSLNLKQSFLLKELIENFDNQYPKNIKPPTLKKQGYEFRNFTEFFLNKLEELVLPLNNNIDLRTSNIEKVNVANVFRYLSDELYNISMNDDWDEKINKFIEVKSLDDKLNSKVKNHKKIKI